MDTLDVLRSSVLHTHETLAERYDAASAMLSTPGEPRKGFESIDTFLAVASKHLGAVDAVLLAQVRRHVPDGTRLVHGYLRAAKDLELALAHVKAREYGSVFQAGRRWSAVWGDVDQALAEHRHHEFVLVEMLAAHLTREQLDHLAERLHQAERDAPSRPHPYAPHTGLSGRLARRVLHVADSFWDAAEGRMVPEPERPPHHDPGLFAQYLLADPRFDEDGPTAAGAAAG
ncbi:MAG: hypothetical protein ACXVEC_12805 [Nocardioides sp.]